MAAIITSYDVFSGDETELAVSITTTATSGIKLAAMQQNGSTTNFANTAGVIEVEQAIDNTRYVEWIAFGGVTVNADSTVTLTDVSRDVSRTGSSLTGSGTGQRFIKGAKVRFVSHHFLLNKKANLDRANTWTAAQTFGAASAITPTATATTVYHGQSLTTSERDALTGVLNGDWIYNETLGQTQWYEGGAWVTNASGSTVADASTTVAGKAEEAILSEVSAGTAAGGTGARLFINPSLVKKTSSGAAEGNVVALNSATMLDGTIGGTGVASPVLGALLIGGGAGLAMTAIGPGSSGQVPVSNGTTIAMGSVTSFVKPVISTAVASATLANPTSETNYDSTYQYTIPANDLVAGVRYYFELSGQLSIGAGNFTFGVRLGTSGTDVNTVTITPPSSSAFQVTGWIMGTAAAGAAAAVKCSMEFTSNSAANYEASVSFQASPNTYATNGSLVLCFSALYGTSNGGNSTFIDSGTVIRSSTTAA